MLNDFLKQSIICALIGGTIGAIFAIIHHCQ